MLFKSSSIVFLLLLLAIGNSVFAQEKKVKQEIQTEKVTQEPAKKRYLQISTNPSTVDLYVGALPADFANSPNYTSPAMIPITEGEKNIIVSFFHPEYADTTINITLSDKDTSYIIVALHQTFDEEVLGANQNVLKHRNRRNLGKIFRWSSIAPFVISGISAIVTKYDIEKAKDHKKALENTRFKNDNYDKHMQNFKDYRESAKTSKTVSKFFLGTGLVLLTAGFVLSF